MQINKLSVILPIYNGMPYLREAIESLLNQSYQDFIVLAIDNGSTDGTKKYLTDLRCEKIKYYRLEEKNLVKALNKGLDLADTPFIARMDSDDKSHPNRFEKQLKFLNQNSEVGIVGTNGRYISAIGNRYFDINLPLTHDKIIQTMLKKRSAIIHASIMLRKEVFKLHDRYDDDYFPCEDYELFLRIGDKIKFANIPDSLYQFRVRKNSVMFEHIKDSVKMYYYINNKYLTKYYNKTINKNLIKNRKLNFWERLDVLSVSIYRKGLYYFLNKNTILGLFYFLITSTINPVRFASAIKRMIISANY